MFLFGALFLIVRVAETGAVSCLDDDGNPVEWFIGYKFPGGYEYAVLIPGSTSWNKSTNKIHQDGMMKNTFEAMYHLNDTPNSFYGMYNDEKPDERLLASRYWWGHMKGALSFELGKGGFWLIHSIPKLSEQTGTYKYPSTGRIYGQHFFCVSLPDTSVPQIVKQLIIARPLFQDSYLAPKLAGLYPNLSLLLNNSLVRSTPHSIVNLSSLHGSLKMKHFSKSKAYGSDLYSGLVALELTLSLEVESWRHGANLPSVCAPNKPSVLNVMFLNFKDVKMNFSSYNDHSKWAVTLPSEKLSQSDDHMWVCLGDINRQYPQFYRGGGTMCVQNNGIWSAFHSLIFEVEPCPISWPPYGLRVV